MTKLYPVKPDFAAKARIRKENYERMYEESVRDPEGFWGKVGQRLAWSKARTRIKNVSFDANNLHIRWFADGELNVSANCLDRHLTVTATKPR